VRYAAERDEPFKWEVYEANSWEGVPIETVSGQNANNSIRITSKFLQAVDEDKPWDLIARTTGKPMKTVSAKGLWDKIVRAAWTTADPGMQFHDVINDWHTCKADGDINASNPCSEYMFLDDTACNLASLNLVKFRGSNGGVDVNAYIHALRLWTVTLDISIQMASFPSRNIAHNTMQYRTLGLGYANLGGLLMRSGIPYDSEVGRNFAAALTSLMTAVAYSTSAEMAGEIGPFPAWERNKHYMAVVMGMHAAALDGLQTDEWSGQLLVAAQRYWSLVVNDAGTVGFRNAQGTLLAPTGTIGLLMDVDTTGCEPETSLVRYKNYAGGGSDKFVCQAVEEGLIKLGYNGDHLKAVLKFVEENGHLAVATENHVAGIWSEHLPVFDCALDRKETTRYIRPMAHIEMLAAIQPFLSGAASKTCNLPETATYEDVDMLYRAAERLKCKAVALYRNNCKLTQPVQTEQQPAVERPDDQPFIPETDLVRHTSIEELRAERTHSNGHDKTNGSMQRGERKYPPNRRYGPAQKVRINDQVIHIRTSEYPDDHSFAEVFVDMGKDGSMLQAVLGQWAKAVSLARQYGAPTEKLVESFLHTRFEPAGFVQEHDHIKSCTSVIDLVAREIGFTYLKRMDLVQVPPDTDHAMHFNPVAFQPQHQTEHSSLMGTAGVVASPVRMVASGNACSVCGNEMEWDGTCLRCRRCGNNTGCGS
jgi:ribonucleoside-diphosphate reductase alpha chain